MAIPKLGEPLPRDRALSITRPYPNPFQRPSPDRPFVSLLISDSGPGGLEVVGINDNGLGSAGDLPSLAVKAEQIAPFRSDIRGDGDLVGKSAVTAAVAAVQQNLARMEKVRTDNPPRDRYFGPSEMPNRACKTERNKHHQTAARLSLPNTSTNLSLLILSFSSAST